jgi:hypothetical protein
VVNDAFLDHIREDKVEYVRGDIQGFVEDGVKFSKRPRDSKPGDVGEEEVIKGDIAILATGFERPSGKGRVPFFLAGRITEGASPQSIFCQTTCSLLRTRETIM